MASSCKKRRFRDPQSVERSIDNVRNAPQTTRYKNHWGCFLLRFAEFEKFGDRFVFNDDKNDKLLAYQICSRSLQQGWQAISRAYSIPNCMLVEEATSRRKWPG
jgi:hypothetical protein